METRANLAIVGLFVLGVIAAGFLAAYWLLRGAETGPRAEVVIVFPGSVNGLVKGAAVTFNGIKVGEVRRLTFAPDDPNRVIAHVSVDANTPLKKDTKASLGFQTLTGVATVQLAGGSADAPPLLPAKDGAPVYYADMSSVQDLMETAKRIMGRADSTLASIDQLVKDNGPSVTKTIKNAETFSNALSENSGEIKRFMDGVGKTADVLAKVSGKIDTLTTDLDGLVKAVDPKKVSQTIDSVTKITGDISKSSGEFEGIVKDIKGGLADARQVIAAVDPKKLNQTITDVSKVAGDLSKSSGEIDGLVKDARGTIADARQVVAAVDPAKVRQSIDNVTKVTGDLAKSSGDIDGIIKDAKATFESIRGFSGNLNATLDDARKVMAAVDPAKVKAMVDSATSFTTYLSGKTKDVDDIVARAKSASANIDSFSGDLAKKSPDVTRIIDDTRKITERLEVASQRVDGILAGVDGLVSSPEGKGLFQSGRAFFEEATAAAKQFKEMAATFQVKADEVASGITRFTNSGTRDVNAFVSDGRRTLNSIERTVSELEKNPRRLIFGGSNVPEYNSGRK